MHILHFGFLFIQGGFFALLIYSPSFSISVVYLVSFYINKTYGDKKIRRFLAQQTDPSIEMMIPGASFTFFRSLRVNNPIQISPFTIHCNKNLKVKQNRKQGTSLNKGMSHGVSHA